MLDKPTATYDPKGHVPEAGLTAKTGVQIVFPPDSRVRVNDTTRYPWNTIGQLEMTFPNGETYSGTGTLIDRQHVLTAAHNVFGNDIGGWARTVTFYPARNGDRMPYGAVQASRWFITEDYFHLSPPNPNESRTGVVNEITEYTEDYAVVRLAQPVNLPIMGLHAPSDREIGGATGHVTGYPGDKPEGEMWTAHGTLGVPDDEFIFYQIDTYRGESGAGVMVNFDLPVGLAIAGVHVAGDEDLETNFAVRLTDDRIRQIIAWMNTADN